MTQAYPLQWPLGWPRTKTQDRERGRFGSAHSRDWNNTYVSAKPITLSKALDRLFAELGRMGVLAEDVIVSTNLQVRLDGLPRSGQRKPDDPGVAVYFRSHLDNKQSDRVIPCDKYTDIEQNIAAVAATISALRALDRYGSGIMERAFTGFEALPPPPGESEPWWVVLGVSEGAAMEEVESAYRRRRSVAHPDKAGSAEQFDRIQKAYERACEERG